MSDSPAFVDPETGGLDTEQLRTEGVRLTKLAVLFTLLGGLPLALAVMTPVTSVESLLFKLFWALLVVIGGGVFLMYVVARGVELAHA